MNVKLSDEQRQALQSATHALPVEDDQNQRIYYLLDEQSYLHLQGLRADHERQCDDRLRELIRAGIESPEVPADEAFARLRSLAEQLSRSA